MAVETHRINIGNDDLLPPWPTVFDVASTLDIEQWVVVGGLMVQLHAYRAQIPPSRPTKDLDVVVNLTATSGSLPTIGASLGSIGFAPMVPDRLSRPIYRFTRGEEQVDVMVPDHLPASMAPRFMQRPAFVVDAGAQAIARRDRFEISSATRTTTCYAPNVLGALVAKGAAALVDRRDTYRHYEDGALLFATIDSVGALGLDSASRNDRRRLRQLILELRNNDARSWSQLTDDDRRRGQANLLRVVKAAAITL